MSRASEYHSLLFLCILFIIVSDPSLTTSCLYLYVCLPLLSAFILITAWPVVAKTVAKVRSPYFTLVALSSRL